MQTIASAGPSAVVHCPGVASTVTTKPYHSPVTTTSRSEADHRPVTRPHQIRTEGLRAVLGNVRAEIRSDHVTLLAAGVAFYAFLSLAPALVAVVTIYGLVAEPADVTEAVASLLAAAPEEVRAVVESQLRQVAQTSSGALGLTTAIALVIAVWGASRAMASLTEALNVAYDTEEHRGFVVKRALGVALTLGALVFVTAAVFTIAVVPRMFDGGPGWLQGLVRWGRWPVLAVAFIVALGVLYRVGPNRDQPGWHWASWGAVVAGALWLVASAGLAAFAGTFGSYDETYGSLASVVVLLLWLWLTGIAVLMGAEVNAEMEREAARQNVRHGHAPTVTSVPGSTQPSSWTPVPAGAARAPSIVPDGAIRLAAAALAGYALGRITRS